MGELPDPSSLRSSRPKQFSAGGMVRPAQKLFSRMGLAVHRAQTIDGQQEQIKQLHQQTDQLRQEIKQLGQQISQLSGENNQLHRHISYLDKGPQVNSAINHVRTAVSKTSVRNFGVPHLIIDDIFPTDLIEQINANWPVDDIFTPEIAGIKYFYIRRDQYHRLGGGKQTFWTGLNEMLWQTVVAAVAEKLSATGAEAFGELYKDHLCIDQPLTLMHADSAYCGHSMHTHFYHCPHWAFTMLLYVDPDDRYSNGTALHRLRATTESKSNVKSDSSYRTDDLEWRTDVAMDTCHWDSSARPDAQYDEIVSDYRANRLFVFMDGPLSFHSVPFDNPDGTTPNPNRANNGGQNARRRILRSHIKIDASAFFAEHSKQQNSKIEQENYYRIMKPHSALSEDDRHFRDTVLRKFYSDRITAYARAAEKSNGPGTPNGYDHFMNRLVRQIM